MSKDPKNEKNNIEKETNENKPVEPIKDKIEPTKENENKENLEKENATENNDSKPSNAQNDSKENSSNKENEDKDKSPAEDKKENPSTDKDKKDDKDDKKDNKDNKDGKKDEQNENKPLSKKELKQIKKERSAQYKLEKKNLQGRKSLSGRGAKNFLIWLMGFLFSFVFLFGGVFIALKIIPLDTYIGKENGYVDEEISSKSLLDAIMNIGSYNVGQLPILTDLVNEVLVGAGLNAYVDVDMEKLKQVQFTYPEESGKSIDVELMNCVKLSPAFISSLEGVSAFEYVEVTEKVDTTSSDFVPQLYYCQEPTMARTVNYVRAYNDDGTPAVDGLDGLTLYYANLADLYLGDLIEVAMPRFGILPVTELVGTVEGLLGGVDLTIVENVLGETTLNEIANFDINSVKVSKLLPYEDENGNPINTEIYGILDGLFVKDNDKIGKEDLVIGDLLETTGAKLEFEGLLLKDLLESFGATDTSMLDTLCSFIVRKDESGVEVTIENLCIGDLTGATADFAVKEDMQLKELLTTLKVADTSFLNTLATFITKNDGTTASEDNLTIGDLTGTTGKFAVDEGMSLKTLLNKLNITDTSFLNTLATFITKNDGTTASEDNITIGDLTGTTATFGVQEDMQLKELLNKLNITDTSFLDTLSGFIVPNDKNREINADTIKLSDLTGATATFAVPDSTLLKDLGLDSDLLKILSKAVVRKDISEVATENNICVGDLTGANGATFSINNIQLTSVLDETANTKLFEILTGIVKVDTNGDGYVNSSDVVKNENITIGALSNINISDLKLSIVLPLEDEKGNPVNTQLYKVLCSAIVYADGDNPNATDITLGDLSSNYFSFNNVALTSVLEPDENLKLYEILRSIVQIDVNGDEIIDSADVVTNDKITIGSLSNIKMGGISLTTVLDNDEAHKDIYALLKDLTGKEPQNIIVDDLGAINTNNIHLNLVLPYDEHVELYKILRDFCGFDESYDPKEILVSDFDGKNPMNMHLKTVLGDSANDEFKSFICDLTHVEDFADITLNDLKDKDPNEMHLSVLIPDGEHKDELVNILKEAVSEEDFNNVTLGSLANFNLSNVHLYTLLPESNENTSDENTSRNHPILKLLAEDETVTVGNMGEKINELRIDQIFEMEVFSKTVNGTAYYLKDGNYYKGTSDDYETYYISKDAKFWLFMLYTAVDGDDVDELVTDANGYADCYVNKNLTFDGLSSGLDNVSSSLTSATIRQLVDAGILTDRATFTDVYAKTLNEVLG